MIRFRPLLVPTLIFLPGVALLIGLGVWQVERLHWKTGIIHRIDTRMHLPPEPLDAALARGLDDAEWRRVTVRGRFVHDVEVYVVATGPSGEPGVQVVTPMETSRGFVLINRGFVPDAKRDPATRPEGQPIAEVTVTGVARQSQAPGWFTPPPDYKKRLWFSKTAEGMRDATGLRLLAPIFIEADAVPNLGGYPVGGQTVVDIPNNHLSYAITWFALALALAGVYLVYHARQGRLGWK